MRKIRSAIEILSQKGTQELIYLMSMNIKKEVYNTSKPWKYTLIPLLLLLYQIHLVLDEHALAYPLSRRKWQIVNLPWFQRGRQLPTLDPSGGYRHGSKTHQHIMRKLYSFNGFVSVKPGDIVVDVGAYIGGFSMVAAETAGNVIAIEPEAVNDSILEYNTQGYDNIDVVSKAAWKAHEQLEINRSRHPSENSILDVDVYETSESFTVQADTVPNIVRELGYTSIDFLKIEAEGVEPEILEGALNDRMSIDKIAVDASAERDGNSCLKNVIQLLEEHGYEWKTKDREIRWGESIVFGKSK